MWQRIADWGLDDWRLWLLVLLALLLLYLARPRAHAFLRAAFGVLANLFLLGGHAFARWAGFWEARCRQQLIEARAAEIEATIERERRQISRKLGAELAGYPELHRRLLDELVALEEDFRASALASPAAVPALTDGRPAEATAGDRRLARERVTRLGRIVKRLGPIQTLLGRLENVDARAQGAVQRIESYLAEYRALLLSPERREAGGGISSLQRFLVGLLFGVVSIGGAALNFFLIERPMAEMVGENYVVAGLPLPQAAALVMILLEASAGLALMEFWGVTRLVSFLDRLEQSKRTILTIACLVLLFALASIEAGLALVREDIIRAGEATLRQVQGIEAPATSAAGDLLPQIVQATLGFVIPFLLALVAIPLELLLSYGTVLVGFLIAGLLGLLAVALRLVHRLLVGLEHVLIAAYDLVVFLPLAVERAVLYWRPAPRTAA